MKILALRICSILYHVVNPFSLRYLKTYGNGGVFFPKIISSPVNPIIINRKGLVYRGVIKMIGENNSVVIDGHIFNTQIDVDAKNCSLVLKNRCVIKEMNIVIRGQDNHLIIEEGTTFGTGCWIVIMGNHNKVIVGKDCMIADDVDIWASDSHPIFGAQDNGQIINKSGSIIIKDHVWLGKKSVILKNVEIGCNSVVGIASVVTNDIPDNTIAVGNSAKVVRTGINWDRKHISI